jgi:uncharacterized protein (TIGR03083 family)
MTTESAAPATLDQRRDALAASAGRLAALVAQLSPDQLRQPSYCDEWSVADVLSHLGSGAVITRGRLDGEVDPQPIWDTWNAKNSDDQAADALRADDALLERLAALSPEEQDSLHFAMGPFDLDLVTYLGMRLSEHVLHTWDVAVSVDPGVALPDDAAGMVVDGVSMIVGFAGKPTGVERTINVQTSGPSRRLQLVLGPDAVALVPASDDPDLTLPTEALVRLIYGRLDPDHTPAIDGDPAILDELRQVFPGF